jgi:Zn-dependent peptidase ImmA (M78 family)
MLAEHFSGCILMPMKWVREKWAETHDLDAIVEIFGVPKQLAYMRLKFLHAFA